MWVESSFTIKGHQFRVSIRQLARDECERIAAQLAWFAHRLIEPDADAEATGWMAFLQQTLLEDVAIAVDDEVVEQLEGMWDEVVWHAMQAFIEMNRLDPTLQRYMRSTAQLAS